MSTSHKYTMTLSLQVLEHLGINLYSNIPAVLSEVVANSYDADATEVNITIDSDSDKIIIKDDGNGMDLTDINSRFLRVGYEKRKDGANADLSLKFRRPVMGRKGIGKLSLFSIAENIEIQTIKGGVKNGFVLNREKIKAEITKSAGDAGEQKNGVYHPDETDTSKFEIDKGTRIIITKFDKGVNKTESFLRKRLARRFSVLGKREYTDAKGEKKEDEFSLKINNKAITIEDRDFFKKLQFIWTIGENKINFKEKFNNILQINSLSDHVTSLDPKTYSDFKIHGWIGTVNNRADLNNDTEVSSNNKISLLSRGKLSQEDLLKSINESGMFANYLIGEINADFLDETAQKDIATSSRQSIREDDIRYRSLVEHVRLRIKEIKKVWTDMRIAENRKIAVEKIKKENPVVFEWFNTLKGDHQEKAKDLFATIESFHFDEADEREKKKELYKQGIIAFEKLRLKEELSKLGAIKGISDIQLSNIFTSIEDIEANSYYDIAKERVEIIKLFKEKLDNNEKEKLIQTYLFDNLWLLDSSWERATNVSAIMEQSVKTAFAEVEAGLTEAEGKGRFDIRYRTSGGKHIIIELKRYDPSYKITSFKLAEQASKYKSALEKCLTKIGEKNIHIEVIVVLGEILDEPSKDVESRLANEDARLVYYDTLVENSINSYQTYLDKNREIGKIRDLIEKI